jgi:hypothetical protein
MQVREYQDSTAQTTYTELVTLKMSSGTEFSALFTSGPATRVQKTSLLATDVAWIKPNSLAALLDDSAYELWRGADLIGLVSVSVNGYATSNSLLVTMGAQGIYLRHDFRDINNARRFMAPVMSLCRCKIAALIAREMNHEPKDAEIEFYAEAGNPFETDLFGRVVAEMLTWTDSFSVYVAEHFGTNLVFAPKTHFPALR